MKEENDNMATQLMTLCDGCKRMLTDSFFRVKPVPPVAMTSEKKDSCEYCKRKFRDEDLKQYTVSGR